MNYCTVGPVAGSKISRGLAHGAARLWPNHGVFEANHGNSESKHGVFEAGTPIPTVNYRESPSRARSGAPNPREGCEFREQPLRIYRKPSSRPRSETSAPRECCKI